MGDHCRPQDAYTEMTDQCRPQDAFALLFDALMHERGRIVERA